MEYFNLFGGNLVSSKIENNVLKIIKNDELQKKSVKYKLLSKKEILGLGKTFEIIGYIRGEGLFLEIEIIAEKM